MKLFRAIIYFSLTMAGSLAHCADYVTEYEIVSPIYTNVSGGYETKMGLSVSFTTDGALAPNLDKVDVLANIRGINLDDGLFSGTNGSIAVLPGSPVVVSTDGQGQITQAKFKLESIDSAAGKEGSVNHWKVELINGRFTVLSINKVGCLAWTSEVCISFGKPESWAASKGIGYINQSVYPKFNAIYVFGDSNSDNGRRKKLIGFPQSPYWEGRHSDGPVAVEYLASTLGIPLANRFDYAVGGAMTGMNNVNPNPELIDTGVLGQMETFKQQLGNDRADPGALYFIKVGVNDFVGCGYPEATQCNPDQIRQMVGNVGIFIRKLYALGARNIFLSSEINGIGDVIRPFNTQLHSEFLTIAEVSSGNFIYYNYADFFDRQTAKENTYGFTKISPAYCFHGNYLGAGTVCDYPGRYAFWDQYFHGTTRAMHGWADDMAAHIKTNWTSISEL